MTDLLGGSGIKRNISHQMHNRISNGFHHLNSDHDIGFSNDAKKVKTVENHHFPPSKVVHLRNLPNENESEIIQLGAPFGKVTNILVLKHKNQAFLEFSDIQTAISMVDYYEKNPVNLHNKRIYVQYSNHQELKTTVPSHFIHILNQPSALNSISLNSNEKPPNSVLKVTVDNLVYPLNNDVILQIFMPFGSVVKLVSFNKKDKFYAIIQYSDIVMAQKAKSSLHGQNIYNGCDTLHIEFSDLTNLQIKAFDEPNPLSAKAVVAPNVIENSLPAMHHHLMNPLTAHHNGPPSQVSLHHPPIPASLAAAINATYALHPSLGSLSNGITSNLGPLPNVMNNLTVLLVSNLNEEKITTYALFVLFGVYGDVQRVKIMYNRKSNALVQMTDTNQLNLAIQNLHKRMLHGKVISVMPSKIQNIQLPKDADLTVEEQLTKDFSQSPLHRFKKPGSKNFQNIAPPSPNLHISNIPLHSTEESLVKLFSQDGRRVLNFRFFPRDSKMALIQMGSEEEAMESLIALHNHKIGDTYLRVSFSKISF